MPTYAPSFGDRPPRPPQPDLRYDEEGNGDDDFVVTMEIEGDQFPRWYAVTPEIMDMLADE